MKTLKVISVIMVSALLSISLLDTSGAQTFHAGGVAPCEGCHTMHNSAGGVKMTTNSLPVGMGNPYLLQGGDQSSTCLICHGGTAANAGGYRVFSTDSTTVGTIPSNYTPGGDFGWLLKTYTWTTTTASSGSSPGEIHGHNVVAADFTLFADTRFPGGSPGGGYPVTSLGCPSCHDPHGKYRIVDTAGTIALPSIAGATLPIKGSGSYGDVPTTTEGVGVYRLLGGKNYQPKSVAGSFAFVNDPPIAVSPGTYNRLEQTADTRVAYGSGMSFWCANCHGMLHNDSYPSSLRHPAGMKLTSVEISNYNAYVKSGDLSGNIATAYASLVPFEEGTTTVATLAIHAVIDGSQGMGADTNSVVMCLSCHRAHASAWDSGVRWNVNATFVTMGGVYPGTNASGAAAYGENAQGRTQAETQAGYYGRNVGIFATYQRSLCNKCHAQD